MHMLADIIHTKLAKLIELGNQSIVTSTPYMIHMYDSIIHNKVNVFSESDLESFKFPEQSSNICIPYHKFVILML